MRSRICSLLASGAIGALLLAGCMLPKSRGQLVGAYDVEGELTDNNCGRDALPAPDHLSFNVELRDDKGEGLWARDTPPPFSGTLDKKGFFSFDLGSSYDVPGVPSEPAETASQMTPEQLADPTLIDRLDQQSNKPCRLKVDERIHGRVLRALETAVDLELDASDDAADLTADNDIEIRMSPGSNCGRVLATQGGPFQQLPCRAHYDLTGELNKNKK